MSINDYILVKDKDGQMKYYKDGKFFSLAEFAEIKKKIEKETEDRESATKKQILTPVLTYEEKKPVAPLASPVKVKESAVDYDDITQHPAFADTRNQDQKMIEARVQEIIARLKVSFSDEKIKARFVNVLTTYFRGIRNEKEIEYVLSLPKVEGGLEIPKEKIKLIITIIKEVGFEINKTRKKTVIKSSPEDQLNKITDLKHRLEPPPPMIVKSPPVAPFKVASPPVSSELKSPLKVASPQVASKVAPSKSSNPLDDMLTKFAIAEGGGYDLKKSLEEMKKVPLEAEEIRDAAKATAPQMPVSAPPPITRVESAVKPAPKFVPMNKPKAVDVKPTVDNIRSTESTRLLGPIEELGTMSPENFRQLGRNLQEAKEIIKEKINLLANQSYTKKAEAIKAWQHSPVFQLYLAMNWQGIMDGKSVHLVIESRQIKNQPTLTQSEFEAINELNKSISLNG